MWFKNLQLFRFTEEIPFDQKTWNDKLTQLPFEEITALQTRTFGFTPPIKSLPDQYIYAINGYVIFAIKEQEKVIPASVINEKLEEKVDAIRASEHRNLTRKERSDLKEDILQELIPRAFSKTRKHYAYINLKDDLLLVNSSAAATADLVIDCLRDSLGRAPLIPVIPKLLPTQLMTEWLHSASPPDGFLFSDSLVLKGLSEQGSTIRCQHQDLLADEINAHLQSGLTVTELALTWKERITFTLNDKFIIKRIKFADIVTEELEQSLEEDEVAFFDQNFTLMALEFTALITDLLPASGGESTQTPENRLKEALIHS